MVNDFGIGKRLMDCSADEIARYLENMYGAKVIFPKR